jgi:4-hydroxy-3-polyprenylbenzoate decarboxylase
VIDLYLPESAHNQFALVAMEKVQAGQSQRILEAVWQFLSQFAHVKFVVLCDDDVNVRDWNDVIWAITTRMDPARDTVSDKNHNTFVSQLGFDATNKFVGEVEREWGTPIKKDPQLVTKVDQMWPLLKID